MTLSPADRIRRGRLRSAAATVIVLAWAAAIGGLVRRDVMRTPEQRLAEMARRVNPGNVFYAVERGGERLGWASFTMDTLTDSLVKRSDTLSFLDEMVADFPAGTHKDRVSTRTQIMLSRGFVLRRFVVDADSAGRFERISGKAERDTAIQVVVERAGLRPDTQRIPVPRATLLPALLPVATILARDPKVGHTSTYHTFDPRTLTVHDVTMQILAESLFVIDDSASMNRATMRWVSSLRDTVRAWNIAPVAGEGFRGWVDAQGRAVDAARGGVRLRRMAYELSFENWRLDTKAAALGAVSESEISASTLIGADVQPPETRLRMLRVRLTAPSLTPFALTVRGQTLNGHVLTNQRTNTTDLTAVYSVPPPVAFRRQYNSELRSEPYIQTRAPLIMRRATTIIGHERRPRAMVEKLVRWVSDSIARAPSASQPDAVQTLSARTGDAGHHAVLFTALARTLDIPARIVSGVVYVRGKFYYHAWAEVLLGDWVAVDPTLGQFPADAAHLRLAVGGVERAGELQRLLTSLHIEVLESR